MVKNKVVMIQMMVLDSVSGNMVHDPFLKIDKYLNPGEIVSEKVSWRNW